MQSRERPSCRVPAFGSSAVRARLDVLCRSSRWLRWDPGDRDGDSGRPPHGSVFLLEPLALTGFKDVCVSGGGDPALAMTEIGYRSEILFNARLRRDSPRSVPTLELLQPFGPSAVGARLGVPCRLGRRLR